MIEGPYKITRNELAQFLPSQRAIRAFEQLFELIPSSLNESTDIVQEVSINAQNADSKAVQALSAISRLADAVELLASAPQPARSPDELPVVPVQQFPANVEQDLALVALAPPVVPLKTPRYGTFYDTTTQNAAAINTAYPVTFNSTDLSFGVRIGSPTSRIIVDSDGVYNFQFSMQLDKVSGGVGLFFLWARINGVDQANSATQIRIQGNNAESVAAWNFVFKMAAGDYFELVWSTDTVDIEIKSFTATPPVPTTPSVILSVTNNIS